MYPGHNENNHLERRQIADMKKRAGILFCSLLIGLSGAGCMVLPELYKEERESRIFEPEAALAWWSLTCEVPNPEKLPVRVRFQWLKGLE